MTWALGGFLSYVAWSLDGTHLARIGAHIRSEGHPFRLQVMLSRNQFSEVFYVSKEQAVLYWALLLLTAVFVVGAIWTMPGRRRG